MRWRRATVEGVHAPAMRATLARTAAVLSGVGALICFAGALVPGDSQHDENVLLATAAAASLLGAVLIAADGRLPVWALHPVALVGIALSTAAAYGWGSESAYGPLLYVWVAMFAFYVFDLPAALVYLALMAAAFGLALALEDPAESPLDGWLATVGTLLGTGLFVSMMRDRLDGLIGRLREAAHRDPLTTPLNRP